MDERVPVGGGAPHPEPTPGRDGPPRRRVLVVDDNETSAQCLALILGLEGYEARAVYDGESALEIARSFRPDIVLTDIGLPGIDGHELARRIRRDRELCAGLKLLAAVTGQAGAEARSRSREVGFDHHFVKPIDPETILALIASLEWHQAPEPIATADQP
jgi:CheY-like chemotaxis protein